MSTVAFADSVKSAQSHREVLRSLNLTPSGEAYYILKSRIRLEKLSTKHFRRRPWKSLDNVMVKNSTYRRHNLKKQIMDRGLLPYICVICGQKPTWKGKPLVLILDHKNGVNNDHRLENLRFVCPNCGSQLPTFAARNMKKCRVVQLVEHGLLKPEVAGSFPAPAATFVNKHLCFSSMCCKLR